MRLDVFDNQNDSRNSRLEFHGFASIGSLPPADFQLFKKRSGQLIRKWAGILPKGELFNLINAPLPAKLESNSLVNEYMVPFLTKALGTALVDIFPVSHIIKPFGVRGDIWHQDSSLVDERRDFALNAWMSFTDSNRINGCLWAIPGSHMNSNHFRQFGVNPITGSFKEELRKLMVPIPSKAGEVILFNRSLIHGSSFNWLPFNRIASECLIVNKGAILYNYHRDKSLAMNRIIGFQVPPEHFLKENPKEDFYNPNTPRIELPDISMEGIREKIQAEIPYYLTHAKKFNLSSNLT